MADNPGCATRERVLFGEESAGDQITSSEDVSGIHYLTESAHFVYNIPNEWLTRQLGPLTAIWGACLFWIRPKTARTSPQAS